MVGNLPPSQEVYEDGFVGAETIALFYAAIETCPPDQPGFVPTTVHIQMQFDPEDVPVSFPISAKHGWAIGFGWFPIWTPCISVEQEIVVSTPGIHEFTLPLSESWECCGHLEHPYPPGYNVYILAVDFPESFPTSGRPSAPLGECDGPCDTWINRGGDWDHAGNFGWPYGSEPLIWAEASYCEYPVATTKVSWSALRARYRTR